MAGTRDGLVSLSIPKTRFRRCAWFTTTQRSAGVGSPGSARVRRTAGGNQVLRMAAAATHPKEPVLETPALGVVPQLLLYEARQLRVLGH